MSSNDSIVSWTREHSGLMLLPSLGAIGAMIGVYFKRHSSPANILLLGLFTVLEAVTLGSVVSYFNQAVVLQALVITTFVFLGLTLFTLQVRASATVSSAVHLATGAYADCEPPCADRYLRIRPAQSKYDFSSMGTYLYTALLVFFFTGIVGIFIPYNRTFDMVMAGAGCLIFSACESRSRQAPQGWLLTRVAGLCRHRLRHALAVPPPARR